MPEIRQSDELGAGSPYVTILAQERPIDALHNQLFTSLRGADQPGAETGSLTYGNARIRAIEDFTLLDELAGTVSKLESSEGMDLQTAVATLRGVFNEATELSAEDRNVRTLMLDAFAKQDSLKVKQLD